MIAVDLSSHLRTDLGLVELTTIGYLLHDDGTETPLAVELHWSVNDPTAVRTVFQTVEWAVGRELLDLAAQGCYAGIGDLRIVPRDGRAVFEMSTPSGDARIALDRPDLARFMVATIAELPVDADSPWPDVFRLEDWVAEA